MLFCSHFLLLFLLPSLGAAEKQKVVIGTIGSSVFLDPEHQGDLSRSEILWTFTGSNKSTVTILDYVPDEPVEEPNEQFRSRLQFNASTGCLLVDRIKPEDQGVYNFDVDERRTTTIELLIFYKLSKTLIRSYSAPGYTIQLTCEVKGHPQKYKWQRNGGEISQRHWLINENRSLVILTDLTGECGTYTCVASNPVSSAQANYTLNPPVAVTPEVHSERLNGIVGQTVHFPACHKVSDIQGYLRIKWNRAGKEIVDYRCPSNRRHSFAGCSQRNTNPDQYEHRTAFSLANASLLLRDLQISDSGVYELAISHEKGTEICSFDLTVQLHDRTDTGSRNKTGNGIYTGNRTDTANEKSSQSTLAFILPAVGIAIIIISLHFSMKMRRGCNQAQEQAGKLSSTLDHQKTQEQAGTPYAELQWPECTKEKTNIRFPKETVEYATVQSTRK
ncbi:contactin rig-6-like isoform X1 [Hemitrygon akajei]|uniref:contactin rig-6-like isoform X1 n=1 Tax=Hemitrygon akajei TaxID=2704970 RepID=UPI003BF9FD37